MKMIKRTLIASIAVAAVSLLASASPAFAAIAGGPSEAVIVSPLSLINTDDLDFGTIIAGVAPGTVTIDANTGARSTAGGAVAAGGTPRRAEFVGAGRPGLLTLISIGPSPTLANGTGGTMATVLVVEGGTGLRLLPGSGIQTIRVGGTLTLGASQQDGNYTGTFTVTAIYF